MRHIAIACALFGAAGEALAAVTYSSILPGDVYNPQLAYVAGAGFERNWELGFSFVAGVSGGLTQLRASMFSVGSPTGPISFRLFAVGAPNTPGALLGDWSAGPLAAWTSSSVQPLLTMALDGSVQVSAGQTYFLIATDPSNTTTWAWAIAGTPNHPVQGGQVYRPPGFGWSHDQQPIAGFELSVPAPWTGVVMLGGMVGVGRRGRRVKVGCGMWNS